jgi:hypothetical protein
VNAFVRKWWQNVATRLVGRWMGHPDGNWQAIRGVSTGALQRRGSDRDEDSTGLSGDHETGHRRSGKSD